MKSHYENRIRYLERKYNDYNVAPGEILSKHSRQKIDKNYNQLQRKIQIDYILNEINNPRTVRDEVYNILLSENLQDLCRRCKIEQIIAIIILYVQRLHNNNLKEEKTKLWNKYDLSWKLYGRIISRLLTKTRKNKVIDYEYRNNFYNDKQGDYKQKNNSTRRTI